MKSRGLIGFGSVFVALWVVSSAFYGLMLFDIASPNVLLGLVALFVPAAFISGFSWFFFTAYILFRHLPKVDEIVSEENLSDGSQDSFLQKVHRMAYYYCALTSERFNRRIFPGFDFQSLSREVALPLKIQGHGTWFCLGAGVLGIVFSKWAELTGVMPPELLG